MHSDAWLTQVWNKWHGARKVKGCLELGVQGRLSRGSDIRTGTCQVNKLCRCAKVCRRESGCLIRWLERAWEWWDVWWWPSSPEIWGYVPASNNQDAWMPVVSSNSSLLFHSSFSSALGLVFCPSISQTALSFPPNAHTYVCTHAPTLTPIHTPHTWTPR